MAAAVVMMVADAAVNALAFSGSNYYFSKLGEKEAKKERERHDKATEQMRAAHDAWSKRRTEELDRQKHVVQTFRDVSAAMSDYDSVLTGEILGPLEPEPQLSDFYTPSSAQKDREISFVIGGMVVAGLVTYYSTRRQ